MKTRIAILGGGISALAAAYELKRLDSNHSLDITIYQMGWRLGGKCASSRNDRPGMGYRNEEHGLHVLGGWYHNTFEMLRRVYGDWNQIPGVDAQPIGTAFLPMNGAVLFDEKLFLGFKYGWRKIAVRFPDPVGEPGLDIPDMSIARMLKVLARWVQELLENAFSGLSLVGLGMRFLRHWFDISDVVKFLDNEVYATVSDEGCKRPPIASAIVQRRSAKNASPCSIISPKRMLRPGTSPSTRIIRPWRISSRRDWSVPMF
ncbi:MAG: NAD(P)-binding protein [Henriciella sp.]|nr:NAD(P)-binding protein [Henriciella sp.]